MFFHKTLRLQSKTVRYCLWVLHWTTPFPLFPSASANCFSLSAFLGVARRAYWRWGEGGGLGGGARTYLLTLRNNLRLYLGNSLGVLVQVGNLELLHGTVQILLLLILGLGLVRPLDLLGEKPQKFQKFVKSRKRYRKMEFAQKYSIF